MLIAGFPADSTGFEYYIDEPDKQHEKRCIDNTITCRSKCTGYCANNMHPGYLTKSLMNRHMCIEKECVNYYRLSNSKSKKIKTNDVNKNEEVYILTKAVEITKPYEGIKIIKVLRNSNVWDLYYVNIAKYDISKISKIIESKLGIQVQMININLSYEESANIIFKN